MVIIIMQRKLALRRQKDTGGALVAAMSLLLVALLFSGFCHHWSTAASAIICEAKKYFSPCVFSALILYSLNTPELEKKCNHTTVRTGPSGC